MKKIATSHIDTHCTHVHTGVEGYVCTDRWHLQGSGKVNTAPNDTTAGNSKCMNKKLGLFLVLVILIVILQTPCH